jgi:hypothetical protein
MGVGSAQTYTNGPMMPDPQYSFYANNLVLTQIVLG